MKLSSLCRFPLLGLTALLILSGCSLERYGALDLVPSGTPYSAADVARIKLSSAEQAAFEREGVLDRHLDPSMEAMVRYHFVKYSRERRITMEHFLRNARPYLAYTKSVFRTRGLPEELAYLAYLESGYSPLAVSRSKATGMWQFIASTGKIYGLSQDWWMDERMDPYRSTHAAADYLTRLYDIFGDWQLAVASYNGGEGAVGRAQKAAKAGELHDILRKNADLDPSVQLREETRLYVPRFLAIVKIMRDPAVLGLKALPPDSKHPELLPVVELKARPGTDLAEFARRIGLTWKEFLAYNPHFLRSISPINRVANVYVPLVKQEQAAKLLKGTLSGIGWRYYTVKKGDTVAKVSRKVDVPESVIRQLNPGQLKRGQKLRLPAVKGSVPPFKPMVPTYQPDPVPNSNVSSALAELESKVTGKPAMPSEYEVQKGDSLSRIASKFGCSIKEIEQANGGSDELRTLRVGQVINLPSVEWKLEEAKKPVKRRTHKVKSGDTLSGIAHKYDCSVKEIQAVNGGAGKLKTLRIGQVLLLPYTEAELDEIERRKQLRRQAEEARKASAPARAEKKAGASAYTVQSGDSLYRIAHRHGTTVKALQQANGGADKVKNLRVGQVILLPEDNAVKASVEPAPANIATPVREEAKPAASVSAPAASAVPATYTVQSGDSLYRIARRFGITVKAIEEANGGADKVKNLRIGQAIKLPGASHPEEAPVSDAAAALSELKAAQSSPAPKAVKPAAPAPTKPAPAVAQPENYKVQSGDSIWSITRRFGMSSAEFKALNPNVDSSSLRIGATVKIIRKK